MSVFLWEDEIERLINCSDSESDILSDFEDNVVQNSVSDHFNQTTREPLFFISFHNFNECYNCLLYTSRCV